MGTLARVASSISSQTSHTVATSFVFFLHQILCIFPPRSSTFHTFPLKLTAATQLFSFSHFLPSWTLRITHEIYQLSAGLPPNTHTRSHSHQPLNLELTRVSGSSRLKGLTQLRSLTSCPRPVAPRVGNRQLYCGPISERCVCVCVTGRRCTVTRVFPGDLSLTVTPRRPRQECPHLNLPQLC